MLKDYPINLPVFDAQNGESLVELESYGQDQPLVWYSDSACSYWVIINHVESDFEQEPVAAYQILHLIGAFSFERNEIKRNSLVHEIL